MPIDPNMLALMSQAMTNAANMNMRNNERAQAARAEQGFLEGSFMVMQNQRQSMGMEVDQGIAEKFYAGSVGQKRGIVTQMGSELELMKFQSQIQSEQDTQGFVNHISNFQSDPKGAPIDNRNLFRKKINEASQMFPKADPNKVIGMANVLKPQNPPSSRTVRVAPDGTIEFTEGATTSTQTELQKDIVTLEQGVAAIDAMMPHLTDENLGVSGNVREFAEKVLPQIPGLNMEIDPKATTGRTIIKATNEQLMRTLSSDPRFNVDDVKRVQAILTKTGAFETGASATAAMTEVKKVLQRRLLLNRMFIGEDIHPELLSNEEIVQAVELGVTPDGQRLPTNTQDDIIKINKAWADWLRGSMKK